MGETIGRIFTPEGDIFGIDWASGNSGEKKRRESTTETEEKGAEEAKQKVLLEEQQQEEKRTARSRFLAKPTSGFGANTNLARSFLSTL